jgi:hypothetical protein
VRDIARVQARPIHSVDECGELRSAQPHHPIADRRPAERPLLEPLPQQHQAGPVPGQDLQAIRSLRPEDEDRSCRSCSRTSAARLSAPRRKSTGFVATSTRMPAGTAITSPPSRRAAPSSRSRDQSQAGPELWQHRARSRSSMTRPGGPAQSARPSTARLRPRSPRAERFQRFSPASASARRRPPTKQLLRGQPVPARNGRHLLVALTALRDDPRLLLRRPRAAPAAPVNTSSRRTGSGLDLGKNSVSGMCRKRCFAPILRRAA